MDTNEKDEFVCWICKKSLTHQKIVALGKCGHVMCKSCVEKFCLKDGGRCSYCDKPIDNKDII